MSIPKSPVSNKIALLLLANLLFISSFSQVGIGTVSPDPSSMLEVSSDSRGILIPRMTTAQRDAISSPSEGLNIYNLTTKTTDVFSNGVWKSLTYDKTSNLVYVYSMADLPVPVGDKISLDGTKMYIFSGFVDISPNYLLLNGAGLRGVDPQKDGVMSNVSGAVLRSVDSSVFIQDLAVIPFSGSTKAYEFSDATGEEFCNIFSGASVVEIFDVSSLGVGSISGFKAVTIVKNYWKVKDGLKIGGTMGKFAAVLNFITGITDGAGLEFNSDLVIDDIDLSNNYFIYSGQTGIKVNAGATVDRGRLTTNMFRGVDIPLDGVTPTDIGWNMLQNTAIRDSKAAGFIYNNEVIAESDDTPFPNTTDFVKIVFDQTFASIEKKFTAGNNRLTYNGRRPITANVFASINGESKDVDYTLAIAKNGSVGINPPTNTVTAKEKLFQLALSTTIELEQGDYIEVWVRTNDDTKDLEVVGFQFSVSE
ncbi:MAG: hypothetical protein WDZ45_00090 [Flavobacteriaceae bacterium]